jgi:hypothetical protein
MRQLTVRVLVASLTFTLGMVTATWLSLTYFSQSNQVVLPTDANLDSTVRAGEVSSPAWEKIRLGGKATFYVPQGVRPRILSTTIPYKAFRREGMEVMMFLDRIGQSAPCIAHSDAKLRRYDLSRMTVGDRDATAGSIENAAFDMDDTEPLKGVIICVPSIGDGEHEFVILARYKAEQDRQDIIRTINSITFH